MIRTSELPEALHITRAGVGTCRRPVFARRAGLAEMVAEVARA